MTPFVFAPRPASTMGVATRCTARPGAARVCFERWAERVAGHAWREEPLGVGLRGIASALGRGRALGLLVSRVLGLLVSLVLDLACWCLQNSHSSKDAIRRRPRGGARPQDPIRAHERRYGPRDHHCGWRCAECSGSGAVAGGGSSSSGCHSSFWRVHLGRDEHRIAVAARGAGAEQLGGAASAAGRAYLPAWPSSCCGSLSICSSSEAAWTSAEGGR